jgi:O-antigen/teichoic acid export membrane protein
MRTVGAVVAVWIWPGALTPVIVLVVATTAQFLLLVPIAAYTAPELSRESVRVTRAELRSLLHVSVPGWLSSGAGLLANQIDRFVVSGWFGLAAVGQYAVAQDLATRLWLMPNILGRAFFPRLARDLAENTPEQHQRTIRSYGAIALASTSIPAVPLAIYGGTLLSAWTGRADLADAATVFAWLLAGVVANCTSVAAFTILQVKLQFRAIGLSYLVFLIMHVVGCSTLPRLYGPAGAAASWALAQVVTATMLQAHFRLRYRVGLLGDMVRILTGAAVITAAVLATKGRLSPGRLDLHEGAFARLAPVLTLICGWCVVGTAATLVFLLIGRKDAGRTLRSMVRRS